MSKILANQIANYGDNSPVEVKEGVNIPAGKPLQAAGTSGSNGQLLASTGNSIEWVDAFDRDYNSLSNLPVIPAAQVRSDWNAVGGIASILNKPIIPPQPSVVVGNGSGSGNLTYNQANGQFDFTPPDLTSFATTTALNNAVANSGNWDTAYAWGNHAAAGYATTGDVSSAVANAGQWNTAYGWGDHAQAGYLTSTTDTLQQVTTRGNTTTQQIIANGGIRSLNFTTGTLNDLTIRHDNNTSKSYISHVNTTDNFYVESTSSLFVNAGRDGDPGGVYLQYNDSTKLSVTGSGVQVGDLYVSGTTDLTVNDLADVDLSIAPQDGQVLKWVAANSKWEAANDLQGSGAGLSLADFSVATLTAGTNALTYNPANGVFSYTPPDLSNYDTAFGWGDHAQAGYLTSETDPVFNAHVASNIIQQNINNWNQAYAWGNHASMGYLIATTTDKTNWNTAYGWGDHGAAGYIQAETDTLASVTGRGASTTNKITLGQATETSALDFQYQGTTIASFEPRSLAFRIETTGSNDLEFQCNAGGGFVGNIRFSSGGNGAGTTAQFTGDGQAWLFYQDNRKLETTAQGVEVNGVLETNGLKVGTLQFPNNNGTAGYVLTSDGAGNATWQQATGGSGGANVTISDTAPGSPSFGDLWWESDKGRLKIYYNDTDSFQWVDASPPLSPTNLSNGGNLISTTGLTTTNDNAIEFSTDLGGNVGLRWRITAAGHLLPAANDTYDIGNASYKIRDLYVNDGSIHTESGKALSFYGGELSWGSDPVITIGKLKELLSNASSFGEFKEYIMGL
tara:strand:- start:13082 stop:15457 length:2376 start_codon:yes stop_codon:yes gene_type:complete